VTDSHHQHHDGVTPEGTAAPETTADSSSSAGAPEAPSIQPGALDSSSATGDRSTVSTTDAPGAPPTEEGASVDEERASSSDAAASSTEPAAAAPPAPAAALSPVTNSATPDAETSRTDLSASDAPPVSSANVLDVRGLDWGAVADAVANPIHGERAERIIARMEERLAGGGPLGLAFEEYAAGPDDKAVQVGEDWPVGEVWFVGDLHGDLLALEAALQHIDRSGGGSDSRIVFLGDLFDDGIHAAEVVLRVFELLLDGPMRITVVTGNHDEGLTFRDGRFESSVIPSDFTDWLNAQSDSGHPWAARLGRVIIRFFARAPRALFFPDGLLVAHGGIPHTDLHAELAEKGNFNDPRVLQDFVWLRAHPRARKRIPNRTTRGSEFGREDFAAFCKVATRLGRPVSRMLRGHDHVEDRFADFPAWSAHPALTINTLGHRLPREVFGPYERVPVIARWVRGELPEVRRLFIPPELTRQVYPEPAAVEEGS
jgi:hypothetical protein